ncbi:di-heme oxidoredictase family protein [Pelagimonas varians]|uniref:Cytochrome c domain-containing protein n=1 Tax=Pelagimonas varians TaxID=696760 RepID=A0A238L0Z1_9RHOB|nr:di-heme oxidoredictase family protein [Pelagimonas varians]PYG27193.1 di-heme oxidoreductase (putative peroxidase) [Pelagimonas varians]SMX48753.1 hypothetical protein PEV8663_03942 [Pelagimonas varians]
MHIPFSPARNHAEEIANVRAGFEPDGTQIMRPMLPAALASGLGLTSLPLAQMVRYFLLVAALASVAQGAAAESFEPVDQRALNMMLRKQGSAAVFAHAFEAGDELSEFQFNAGHGVGAQIGEGRRFTRIPRADLNGPGEWASHFPKREGGANATSCVACHNVPIANGAGDIAQNVVLDPAHKGDPKLYLERNTLPIVALGPVQRAAEEMSLELSALREKAVMLACTTGRAEVALITKGVDFGSLVATRTDIEPCKGDLDTSGVTGVDVDLVVRAFGWKGNHATIRGFTRGALHNELGLQAVETVGAQDGDFDGVTEEITVGDLTALTMYMAALERPVSRIELADLGLDNLTDDERAKIERGTQAFAEVGCTSCHRPTMTLQSKMFSEPSHTPGFFDETFPDGSNPARHSFQGASAVTFDMTRDQPNNRIPQADGGVALLGALPVNAAGEPVLAWLSDFKRHDMGPALADPDAPLGIGAQMWLTRSLAGVGSTGPWLHDGRATTLSDAILAHGGAGQTSADGYAAAPDEDQEAIVAYLENLVIYKYE